MPQTRVQYLCNFLCNRKNKVTEFVFVNESGCEGVNHFATVTSPWRHITFSFFLDYRSVRIVWDCWGGLWEFSRLWQFFFAKNTIKLLSLFIFFAKNMKNNQVLPEKCVKLLIFLSKNNKNYYVFCQIYDKLWSFFCLNAKKQKILFFFAKYTKIIYFFACQKYEKLPSFFLPKITKMTKFFAKYTIFFCQKYEKLLSFFVKKNIKKYSVFFCQN